MDREGETEGTSPPPPHTLPTGGEETFVLIRSRERSGKQLSLDRGSGAKSHGRDEGRAAKSIGRIQKKSRRGTKNHARRGGNS